MKCLVCNLEDQIKEKSDYKFEVKEDINFFGPLKIYSCDICKISFANPMPEPKKLNYFYENIYRQINRPPYWVTDHEDDAKKRIIEDKNLNYLLYISTLIDLKKIENIYDFGAGYGDLGYAIKKKFPHINLYCTEYDKYCLSFLKDRGYINKPLSEIDQKFDLIITTHALEHLTSLDVFDHFYKILKPGGLLFFEVPNCPDEYFSGRPYDGPHLIFYTKESINNICKKFNFSVNRIDFASYSFENDHKYQRESQDRYYRIKSGKSLDSLKQFIKKFIPRKLLSFRNFLQNHNNINLEHKLSLFTCNSGDNCYLRGILKKNNEL